MQELTVANLEASADDESSSLSSQLLESQLSRLRCQYGIDTHGSRAATNFTSKQPELLQSQQNQESVRPLGNNTAQAPRSQVHSSRSYTDVDIQHHNAANQRSSKQDSDLQRQNVLLQAMVDRQMKIIAQLQQQNAEQERELRRQEDNFKDLVTDMQARYDSASAHFQQQIADLKQKLQLMDAAAQPASTAIVAPEVQLAKQRQETLLMDQQLQMLSQELQYKQQLGQLNTQASCVETIQQINAQTLEIVQRNQQQMLARQIEAARLQQEQQNLLLAKNQENIISAYNRAAALQGVPLAVQHQVTQAQTTQQSSQAVLFEARATHPTAQALNLIRQQPHSILVQQQAAQRPENLIQHNYTPRVQNVPRADTHGLPEQPQPQNQPQIPAGAVATAIRQPQPMESSRQINSQAESLMLSTTNHPASSTPMKKSVKFMDSPPEDFVYKQLEPTIKAPPQTPTKRLDQQAEHAIRQPAQIERGATQHASNADFSGTMTQQPDDIPVEHLADHFTIQKRNQVEKSSRITGFREQKLSTAPGKDIPKLKEAITIYMQTHLGQQYKLFDKQLHIAEIIGDYLGVSAQEGLQQVAKSRECYDKVLDMLQQLGNSTTMSQLQILLRVHDVFVRYVTFDDLERLRKEERMPRPEGSGSTIVRLPLMQGKKWLVAALLQ